MGLATIHDIDYTYNHHMENTINSKCPILPIALT